MGIYGKIGGTLVVLRSLNVTHGPIGRHLRDFGGKVGPVSSIILADVHKAVICPCP